MDFKRFYDKARFKIFIKPMFSKYNNGLEYTWYKIFGFIEIRVMNLSWYNKQYKIEQERIREAKEFIESQYSDQKISLPEPLSTDNDGRE